MTTDKPYIKVPTWKDGEWIERTEFQTRDEFLAFLQPLFKEPGQYGFDETSHFFNEQARRFVENKKNYCASPRGTDAHDTYWDNERRKCRRGAIFISGDNIWYLPGFYYMFLNFLQIYHKEQKVFEFAEVRDAQYHIALYITLAILQDKHIAVIKKRQIAWSYLMMALFICEVWFEEGPILKMGASLDKYVNDTWKYLTEYRSFLNKYTAWTRDFNPGGNGEWEQKVEMKDEETGVTITEGLKGKISGFSLARDPANSVGGGCSWFYYEEAGIAPTMDDTFEFLRPALYSGEMITGHFVAGGSVGDLDQCDPLKEFIFNPDNNDVLGVTHNYMDDKGTEGTTGLFIPEHWSMHPCIDEFGNSKIEEALDRLVNVTRPAWKEQLDAKRYRHRISQHPINLEEAFGSREDSRFPLHLIDAQEQRIKDNEYPLEYVDLERNDNGTIDIVTSKRIPIDDFPIKPREKDKRGVLVIKERPQKGADWGTYLGSIDPVSAGKAEYVRNKVYTPSGLKEIGTLKVGDFVIGSDGKPTKVNGVFQQGKKDLYRVVFNDGFSILCCKEHLWAVRKGDLDREDWHVLSVEQMLNEKGFIEFAGTGHNKNKIYRASTYYRNANGSCKWMIPLTRSVVFKVTQINLDPYFLGLLLGDGGMSQRDLRFTTADQELVDYISSCLPDDITIKPIDGRYDYRISTSRSRNSITGELRRLGLQGKTSKDKFIPDSYLYSTPENRLALLRGLMDTDGSFSRHSSVYYSVSEDLARGVVQLVQSLGGVARISKKIIPPGRGGLGYCFIVVIVLPDGIAPFKLKRKADLFYTPYRCSRYIKDISFERKDDAVCISVEAKDNLYVTEHAVVTHNTTTSVSLCSIYIYKNPVEVTKEKGTNLETKIEQDGLVAWWCGRYDDPNDTHRMLEMIIELYNAWTLVEVDVSTFITYMVGRRKQHFLIPKDKISFLKEMESNTQSHQLYGYKRDTRVFDEHLLVYLIDYLTEIIHEEKDEEGRVLKTTYGVERIGDIMALVEMRAYKKKLNVDRLSSLAPLIAFARVFQANVGYSKRREAEEDGGLDKSKKLTKLDSNPFRVIGKGLPQSGGKQRSLFKNIK